MFILHKARYYPEGFLSQKYHALGVNVPLLLLNLYTLLRHNSEQSQNDPIVMMSS